MANRDAKRPDQHCEITKVPAEYFTYVDGALHAERVPLREIAESYGTPCYVYSRAALERRFNAFHQALFGIDHLICYSVKANSNLAVLDVLARLGSGFDIVSAGELERVLAAGGKANRTVFSGVGKAAPEIAQALEAGVLCFNMESGAELDTVDRVARAVGKRAPVSFRVNPDVDARTHPYIATGLSENKFGVPIEEVVALYRNAARMEHVEVHGVDFHIGSQQTSLGPFVDALDRVLKLVDTLEKKGIPIRQLNVGGGLGIRYKDEKPPAPAEYIAAIRKRLENKSLKLLVEPGRAIAGNAGVLLTRVLYLKRNGEKRFAITDAAMNDLVRPALYGAWQEVRAVSADNESDGECYDIVGPVCESSDFLAKDRVLDIEPGSLLAILSAGAYGFVMSSNYNTRPRAAEVMVDGERAHLVRRREKVKELFALESRLPEDGNG